MSGIGLRGVVNETLLNRFRGLAQGNSTDSLVNSLKGGSSSVDLSSGLRVGAQTYATAVQGINASISYLNIAGSTLSKLGEITDKLINITEKSAKISTSSHSRKRLDFQFQKLTHEFTNLVKDTKFQDEKLLSVEGLTELLVTVGLDKETSSSIANIFSKFVLSEEDDLLASEEIKGPRPIKIPPSAYNGFSSESTYRLERITNSDISDGVITNEGNLFVDTDDILNQNGGYEALFSEGLNGTVTSLEAGSLSASVTMNGYNSSTGYSIIESNADFLGFNGSNYNQLYLVDSSGTVVHQLTNEASNVDFGDAAIDANNSQAVYSRDDAGTQTIHQLTIGTIGDDPSLDVRVTEHTYASGGDIDTTNLQISNDGNSFAYQDLDLSPPSIFFNKSGTTRVISSIFAGLTLQTDFAFASSDTLIFRGGDTNSPGTSQVLLYNFSKEKYGTSGVSSDGSGIQNLTILEPPSGNGYFAYYDPATYQINVNRGNSLQYSIQLSASDTVDRLSLSFNQDDPTKIDLGIVGNLSSLSGDSDTELYRYSFNPASTGTSLASQSREFDSIFDNDVHIRTRANAYRVLNDLKELRSQITENSDAISYATDIVGKNLDLVRETGLAMLELADQITGTEEATSVARDLRKLIRKNAGQALSQAENLESIAVAALTLDEDSFG